MYIMYIRHRDTALEQGTPTNVRFVVLQVLDAPMTRQYAKRLP